MKCMGLDLDSGLSILLALLVLISLMSFLVPAEEHLCRFFLLVTPLFMVTYLQRTATFLVPSSGLTALDVWMLTCISFIFIAMIW